jgi:hypothetical protein
MRFLVLLVGMVALSMFAGPVLVLPAVAGDADPCAKRAGDGKIAACTRSINSGRWTRPNLAWAYTSNAYDDNAIGDLGHAIRLNAAPARTGECSS